MHLRSSSTTQLELSCRCVRKIFIIKLEEIIATTPRNNSRYGKEIIQKRYFYKTLRRMIDRSSTVCTVITGNGVTHATRVGVNCSGDGLRGVEYSSTTQRDRRKNLSQWVIHGNIFSLHWRQRKHWHYWSDDVTRLVTACCNIIIYLYVSVLLSSHVTRLKKIHIHLMWCVINVIRMKNGKNWIFNYKCKV